MSYLNITEVDSALLGLANAYPEPCSIITLPNTTAESRTSRALRIGKVGTPKTKGVLLTGCIQAGSGAAPRSVFTLPRTSWRPTQQAQG